MIESRHSGVFKRLLAEYRQTLLEAMVGTGDVDTFKNLRGRIQGLADAVNLSDAADEEINGG